MPNSSRSSFVLQRENQETRLPEARRQACSEISGIGLHDRDAPGADSRRSRRQRLEAARDGNAGDGLDCVPHRPVAGMAPVDAGGHVAESDGVRLHREEERDGLPDMQGIGIGGDRLVVQGLLGEAGAVACDIPADPVRQVVPVFVVVQPVDGTKKAYPGYRTAWNVVHARRASRYRATHIIDPTMTRYAKVSSIKTSMTTKFS